MRLKKGFTLMELLLVLVVLAILAALALPAYKGVWQRVNAITAFQQLADVQSAFDNFVSSEDASINEKYQSWVSIRTNAVSVRTQILEPYLGESFIAQISESGCTTNDASGNPVFITHAMKSFSGGKLTLIWSSTTNNPQAQLTGVNQ